MQKNSYRRLFTLAAFLLSILVCPGWLLAQTDQLRLPPIPEDGRFTQDLAALLSGPTRDRIGEYQRVAYSQHQTPIIVITIHSQADYSGSDMSIEEFTQRWFDQWEIGFRDRQGKLVNKAILVLVSVQDRKARIELGAQWGRKWDKHCDKIMQTRMVPQFKNGNYSQGILAAFDALASMASDGPEASPPIALPIIEWDKAPFPGSPVPLWGVVVLFSLSFCCFVAAYFYEEYRKHLIWIGLGLFAVGFMLWIVLIVLSVWGRSRSGGGGSFGGGFSSGGGGFGSGGFSGGGGATGSW